MRLLPTVALLLALSAFVASAADRLEKTNGSRYTGRFIEQRGDTIYFEVLMGSRRYRMQFDKDDIAALTVDGERRVVSAAPEPPSPEAPTNRPTPELTTDSESASRDMPDWWGAADLTPAQRAVKACHAAATNADASTADKAALAEAFYAVGDWKRAAVWWLQADARGTDDDPYALAWCLVRIGAKTQARRVLPDTARDDADLSLLKVALAAEHRSLVKRLLDTMRQGNDPRAWQQLGDRLAGEDTWQAAAYCYAVILSRRGKGNHGWTGHICRARQALVALYRDKAGIDLRRVPDGTYTASCRGFVDDVGVQVRVKAHRIADVRVVRTRENRPFDSLKEMPRRIERGNGLKGVDTVSRATVTSNAILAATGEALKRAERSEPSGNDD